VNSKKDITRSLTFAKNLGSKAFPPQPYFQAEMAEKNLYRDGIHPNDNGQQVIAEAMLEELKPLVIQ